MTKAKLKREIGLLGVYAIATGTTLSAGFFLLPGLAAEQAGAAIVLAYIVAATPLVPAMFSIIELATAMPRAGGVYYFLDRSLGPWMGTLGGIGTWLALVLKVSFALVGMGAYIALYIPELPMTPVAVAIAVGLGILNLLGAQKSGGFQMALVLGLLTILGIFIGGGVPNIEQARLTAIFEADIQTVLSTAGLVYISYVGVTTVASLSEEVKHPERNLPLGVIFSLITALLVYALGTSVMVGVLPLEQLVGDLTPAASAAKAVFGNWGAMIISLAALLAFTSVANAGMLSASRFPLAMSRDHMMPRLFQHLNTKGAPVQGVLVTMGVIVLILIFLDPTKIAKLASAFQLLMFALVCLAVIVMRESGLASYDSGYHSPLYPWMQLFGMLASCTLIVQMGWLPSLFSVALILLGTIWYFKFARDKVNRDGAIYHMFERWGQRRHTGLDVELRSILKEKGLRDKDPFEEIAARSLVIDLDRTAEFEDIVRQVSKWLSGRVPHTVDEIEKQLLDRTHIGSTPVTHGVGLPHLRIDGIEHCEMVLVRSLPGIHIQFTDPLTGHEVETQLTALFFLFSPEHNPSQHLRILAQIARRADDENFLREWHSASDEVELKEVLLRDEAFLLLTLRRDHATADLIGRALIETEFPEGCLVAMLRRGGRMVIPRGNTVLQENDRLTILGNNEGLRNLEARFGGR
ncbi:MAG: amino acid permease [Gemmatimonadetes bacterium]|nr:amino acid permease [Gemmatimonadota bacterium]